MRLPLCAFVVTCVLACSGTTPASFAGTYAVTVVDGANNCNVSSASWTQGSSANINVQITQDSTMAQINIQGLVGAYLALALGADSFSATVSGNTITATYLGNSTTTGSCTSSNQVTISATIDSNNNLSGTITYTPHTNNDPSCGVLNTCTNQQTFSGVRTGP